MKLRDVKASYTPEKRDSERFDLWLYHVGRRFSWPVAWLAIRMGVSATTVTIISVGFVCLGAVGIAMGGTVGQLLGALSFQLWLIFDCADGSVARATGSGSNRGEYADALGGYAVSMLLYSSMGIAAARGVIENATSISLPTVYRAMGVLIAGFGASLTSLYARLLYQKFRAIFGECAAQLQLIKPRDARHCPAMMIAQNLAANSGFPLPLAFLSLLLGYETYYVLGYLLINILMLIQTVRKTLPHRGAHAIERSSSL